MLDVFILFSLHHAALQIYSLGLRPGCLEDTGGVTNDQDKSSRGFHDDNRVFTGEIRTGMLTIAHIYL